MNIILSGAKFILPFLQCRVSFRILAEGKQNQIKWDDGGAKKF